MNVIIFLGGFLIALVIALVVVEHVRSRDTANLVKVIREQSEFIDKLSKSAEDISNLNAELIETCKQLINLLP